jgi:phage N-6-adenine-methyltransferase
MKGIAPLMSSARTGGSEQDEWRTPRHIVEAIDDHVARIAIDAFASKQNCVGRSYLKDALADEWEMHRLGVVFCNPPYSIMKLCAPRMREQQLKRGFSMVSLVPVRSSEKWWPVLTDTADAVIYFVGRLKFMLPDGTTKKSGAPFPSALVLHDVSRTRARKLAEAVGGKVWTP